MDVSDEDLLLFLIMHMISAQSALLAILVTYYVRGRNGVLGRRPPKKPVTYSLIGRFRDQIKYLDRAINTGDDNCQTAFRMNRACFMKLCYMLNTEGGLQPSKYVGISEKVATFLNILSHHSKNRRLKFFYHRSGHTVSKYFRSVLLAVLKLHPLLFAKLDPVDDDEENNVWKVFKGCIDALDGTHVKVRVSLDTKPRYRGRKSDVTTNILCACDRNGLFTYILAGWEGSAADGRILKDAITRPNGMKVPLGTYYLCDGGYTNGEGFLTPYRGVRYHLKEWVVGRSAPQNYQEYFNMKHARARNVIECAFCAIKNKWGILRSNSFFPIKTQSHIVMACVLLHNFIKQEMGPNFNDFDDSNPSSDSDGDESDEDQEYVEGVEHSDAWQEFRETLAMEMYNQWRGARA